MGDLKKEQNEKKNQKKKAKHDCKQKQHSQ